MFSLFFIFDQLDASLTSLHTTARRRILILIPVKKTTTSISFSFWTMKMHTSTCAFLKSEVLWFVYLYVSNCMCILWMCLCTDLQVCHGQSFLVFQYFFLKKKVTFFFVQHFYDFLPLYWNMCALKYPSVGEFPFFFKEIKRSSLGQWWQFFSPAWTFCPLVL